MRSIVDVAQELSLTADDLELYGRAKAKVALAALERGAPRKGRLILVSAINPTPAGEGKTTISVSLAMGMRQLGKHVVLALRQPSLGPVFGIKGGGTGGGRASLEPADDINLHCTGDIHAVGAAHNLLAALIDNALHFRDDLGGHGELDPGAVSWPRVTDMNDRALRHVVLGLGGKTHGVPREARFDITAASEVMAILALAQSYEELEARLARVVVGSTEKGTPVTAEQLGAAGAMTALLRDALKPNLVQTAEGGPALVHCGPFGNIAHGCSSVLSTRLAVRLGDYAITEAGFGFDLGGEKFLDIKCRAAGIWPRVVVLVATLRALKMHGGVPVKEASAPNPERLEKGLDHLRHHVEVVGRFGLPAVVALNVFPNDPPEELRAVEQAAGALGVLVARCEGFARGGEGSVDLARVVCEVAHSTDRAPPTPRFLYALDAPLEEKIRGIARGAYGARDVVFAGTADKDLRRIESLGYAGLPVCMAKTQLSLTDDPKVVGRPHDFIVTVRAVRLSAGAGFVVPLLGEMMTMPGLPKQPAARGVKLLENGRIKGLMQND